LIWAVALAAMSAILVAPASALASQPAVDEYTLRLPTAQGDAHPSSAPAINTSELSPAVAHRLETMKDGVTLAQIATSRELGAPKPSGHPSAEVDSGGRGVVTAAFAAAGDGSGLLLVAALIAIAVLAWLTKRGRQTER
jgi:hypothetical protein